ncbi:class I SAM-dependent methyltransferase [Novosphingopyxis iocasae]|mgnify:CR=1 FL=1|uniref:class I SAM-dependent methyltransferase n=1 Tax=Novosphingopyxis iocasae TaxID=2762729 RepID=UPI0016516B65|nr:class I SAM-dependent methyltransferase [Novosphingopyxis iocasae]
MSTTQSPAFWRAIPSSALSTPRAFRPSSWTEHVPFAFWIVDAMRPRSLVELGTWYGMSYLAFCQSIQQLGCDTRAMAIDTWRGDTQAGAIDDSILRELRTYHDPHYTAFSTLEQSDFDSVAANTEDGSIDLLHIDGLHTFEAVSHDFETWLPKMSDRGVILFHDTQVKRDDFGVYTLWADVSSRYPSFEFHHEHGLGVLGVGSQCTPSMEALFAAAKDVEEAAKIRDFFSTLGRGLRQQQLRTESDAKLDRLRNNPLFGSMLKLRRMVNG